jgi:hypothetical protein
MVRGRRQKAMERRQGREINPAGNDRAARVVRTRPHQKRSRKVALEVL